MISSITRWAFEGLAALNSVEHGYRQGMPISRWTGLIGAIVTAVLAMAVPVWGGTAAVKYSGGAGEPNDPYRIVTAEDLNDIGNYEEDWDKYFVLVNDVNLVEYTGKQFKIIGRWIGWYDPNNKPFTGVFDGNDNKIWNFTWDSNGINSVGLFGNLGSEGQIKNLGIENVDVNATNGNFIGGLVGWMDGGTIAGCYSTGRVSGNRDSVAGLVGDIEAGTITNCYSTASILGTGWNVGGLVGFLCGIIADSYAAGYVTGTGAGGLLGHNEGIIYNCWAAANVTGPGTIGGLVGRNCEGGIITNCYATGSVDGNNLVAGLVATSDEVSRITNCYSTGRVNGNNYVGGLVGYKNPTCLLTASFWDKQTSGQSWSAGGTPKTTAEMKMISTFASAGWDFVEVWGIGENQTYPFLRSGPAGDLNNDRQVDFMDLAILAEHWLASE